MTFVKTVFWWTLTLAVGIVVSVLIPTIANANPMTTYCEHKAEYFDLVIQDKYIRKISLDTSMGETVNAAIGANVENSVLIDTIAITKFVYENDFTAESAKIQSKIIYNNCIKGYN